MAAVDVVACASPNDLGQHSGAVDGQVKKDEWQYEIDDVAMMMVVVVHDVPPEWSGGVAVGSRDK